MGVTFANPQMVAKIWRGIRGPNIVNWQKQKHYAFKRSACLPAPFSILIFLQYYKENLAPYPGEGLNPPR